MSTNPARPQRRTRQRTAIRELLLKTNEFRTAQQLHEELRDAGETIGLATVYRTLQAMAEADEVDVLRTPEGEQAFRVCSDGHHHHLVCRKCGATVEIAAQVVENWTNLMAKRHGFTDTGHHLEIFGYCPDCGKTR